MKKSRELIAVYAAYIDESVYVWIPQNESILRIDSAWGRFDLFRVVGNEDYPPGFKKAAFFKLAIDVQVEVMHLLHLITIAMVVLVCEGVVVEKTVSILERYQEQTQQALDHFREVIEGEILNSRGEDI